MSTFVKILRGVLTGFIVFVFLVAGIMKLSDKLSAKTHEQMVSTRQNKSLVQKLRSVYAKFLKSTFANTEAKLDVSRGENISRSAWLERMSSEFRSPNCASGHIFFMKFLFNSIFVIFMCATLLFLCVIFIFFHDFSFCRDQIL